ncbi:MAG: homoserine kinase, partial [Thermoanaerobaculia bacterium]
EHAADGAWHGDNGFAALLGGFVLVEDSSPRTTTMPVALPFPGSLRLVLVHPGLELPTKESRAVLPRSVTLGEHVRCAAALASLISALYRGDLEAFGRAVTSDALVEPARAPLVRGYAAVTAAMREAGALGWALAGAGPSLMAVTQEGPLPLRIGKKAVAAFRRAGVEATASVHRIDSLGTRLV